MNDGPNPPGKALLSVWELEGTEVACDQCSRNARYAVFIAGKDYYYCGPHTRQALTRTIERTALVASYG